MKLPVEIQITNKRLSYREIGMPCDVPEPRESTDLYSGYMRVSGRNISIDYQENGGNGEKLDTSVIFKDGIALISRRGETRTNLVFSPGKSCDCMCDNGTGHMSLRVSTKKLSSDIGRLGGKLKIDYTVEIMGSVAEKNSMCVSVCPSGSAS